MSLNIFAYDLFLLFIYFKVGYVFTAFRNIISSLCVLFEIIVDCFDQLGHIVLMKSNLMMNQKMFYCRLPLQR